MAVVRDIRRRIKSVTNTRKITRAMELVAAAKLRKAQARIEAMRPFADRMLELMAGTARASTSVRGLPLLQQRDEIKTVALVPVAGDRGLSGAFNSQVMRRVLALERQLRREGKQVKWVPVARYADAQAVAHRLAELYTEEEVDQVTIVYNAFVSPLVQRVTVFDILPLSEDLLETDEEERERDTLQGDFIFEPEPEEILARLLPVYIETELYRALLESAASKHGAQMTAMRNASKNAGELIDSLTLAMNRARQAEITQEILEVVAGADALTA
ncbi:MAG: F0F1 ATP synthase subunit gamma [Actinobacteria bacterium]|nr:MAG: F0F1 ATP synthase subunit gamma [Actinomycetota bacterium]